MKKAKSDYAILTVTNALRLLEEFRGETEIGVAELARRLVLHKNNVFRLLATLEEEGYIEQNHATGRYRLGLAALQLGQSFSRSRPLLIRGPAYVEELAGTTAESAHLAMLDGFDAYDAMNMVLAAIEKVAVKDADGTLHIPRQDCATPCTPPKISLV